MWILTQNGERILSTEALDEIKVADPAQGKSDYAVIMSRRIDGKSFALGFYNKKDRAVSTVEGIIREQGAWLHCDGSQKLNAGGFQPSFAVVPPKTYIMPPDKDEAFIKEVRA